MIKNMTIPGNTMEFPPKIHQNPSSSLSVFFSQGSFAVLPPGALSVVGLPPAPLGAPVGNAGLPWLATLMLPDKQSNIANEKNTLTHGTSSYISPVSRCSSSK
jgi:hypothetical protein